MYEAAAFSPTATTAVPAAILQRTGGVNNPVPPAPGPMEVSFRSVEIEGRNLTHEPHEIVVDQLADAIRLADLRRKPELNINDITPLIEVGDADAAQVPIIQQNIQDKLMLACKKMKRPLPECRLDLSHGKFNIRCYLGRTKPSDHIFAHDLVSDSR